MNKKRVLSIGKRKEVLKPFTDELIKQGFSACWTNKINRAISDFNGEEFDLIAFGRGVDSENKENIKNTFSSQNPDITFLSGLAPITDLLVAQIKYALFDQSKAEHIIEEFNVIHSRKISFSLIANRPCTLEITLYSQNLFFHTKKTTLFKQTIESGSRNILTEKRKTKFRQYFIVVKANEEIRIIKQL